MNVFSWWLGGFVSMSMGVVLLVWHRVRLHLRRKLFRRAKREFRWQRERLEAKFVQIREQRTGSTLRRWVDCDFDNDVTFVRSRSTGQLSAFVSITVTVEEILTDLEMNQFGIFPLPYLSEPSSRALRNATAVFIYDKTHWDTDGQSIFNLSPAETIRFYRRNLQEV